MKHNIDGANAEMAVIEYLKNHGYKILDHNWKTPKCEIDIVAKKDKCVHFVEVKYRSSQTQGSGFDYITDSKQKQMAYAAEVWVVTNRYGGVYCLSGASVSGQDFEIEFIEEI